MDKRNQRIESFINSLETVEMDGGCQAVVLGTDLNMLGGGAPKRQNGGDCKNSDAGCYNATNNGNCSNYESKCGSSSNKGACENTPAKDKDIQTGPVVANTTC